MIRFVIGLFIFAVVLCAYIVNTQHGGILPQTKDVVAETTPPPETVIAPEEPLTANNTAAQIVESIVDRDLGYTTVSVPVGSAVRDTLSVLGLQVSGGPPSPPDQRFARMIGEALKKGTPDADIIATVNATARAGALTVPVGLVRADLKIDTATYLKAVLTTAVLVTEDADPVVPDLSKDPSAIITAKGYDYVIKETDSLAAIAIKFYGDIMQTKRIVQANPVALARPDNIKAGTTISIPSF